MLRPRPALLACLCLISCAPAGRVSVSRPSVLLVTIDTLRYDRTLAGGPMPRLGQLASRGVAFTRAHAEVPLTLPSHVTMLTGRGPRGHGVRENIGYELAVDVPAAAASFAAAGYATAAFIGGFPLMRSTGLARGFDLYDDRMTSAPRGAPGPVERPAGQVVAAAMTWLEGAGENPWFAWLHIYDPHAPYDAPPPFAGRFPNPYDDEVAYVDNALGRLFDWMEATGRAGRAWTVVVSDHGEALGDHGELSHGVFLYESVLRVPLIVVPPGGAEPRQDDTSVRLSDLAPTLLQAAGLETLPGTQGVSLTALVAEKRPLERETGFYIESLHPRKRYGWAPLSGTLEWPRKFIEAPTPELYDLSADPAETRNLFDPREGGMLRARLDELRGEQERHATGDRLSEEDLRRLASLGYTGGAITGTASEDAKRPDPKDRAAALAPIEHSFYAQAAGRNEEARALLEQALQHDPVNPVALEQLGGMAQRAGDVAGAESYFRKGLQADPTSDNLANLLGMALARQGRVEEAAAAFRQALASRPKFPAARFSLAVMLDRLGRHQEAVRELEQVAREEPGFPGLARAMQGMKAAAARQAGEPRR